MTTTSIEVTLPRSYAVFARFKTEAEEALLQLGAPEFSKSQSDLINAIRELTGGDLKKVVATGERALLISLDTETARTAAQKNLIEKVQHFGNKAAATNG